MYPKELNPIKWVIQFLLSAAIDFVVIAAGYYHSLALKSDGRLVGWGNDDYGQATPPDPNNFDFVAIAAGYDYGLTLKKSSKPGDFNFDGQVDSEDLRILGNNWLKRWPFADIAPKPAGNRWVNWMDFALFAQDWLESYTP